MQIENSDPRSRGAKRNAHGAPIALVLFSCVVAGFPAVAFGGVTGSSGTADGRSDDACRRVARDVSSSCDFNVSDEYWVAIARCDNARATTRARQDDCARDAARERNDSRRLCADQLRARLYVCSQLGGGAYQPEIDPEDFVSRVTNPYFPLVPGTVFVYEGDTAAGRERNVLEVTQDTRTIRDVSCVVVRDTVTLDGAVVEDTIDWYAQDRAGNVWYFGEEAKQYEDGVLVGIDGSWRAGVDDAQPGIVMESAPRVGDFYRQEFAVGEAEDDAGVIARRQSVQVPFGSYNRALETEESSAIEPSALEHKYYVPGVGFVLAVDIETGERLELVSISTK